MMNPKVFVCHASEDKERFVLDFATKLRSKGIDAWVDKWEILPGDSLVNKIFEEGIKNAQAVIVVLSKYSVNKPWVQEELNASLVKKIQANCKLIPVVIEDCEVPECLKPTVWERIKDLKNYDTELDQIVMSIYGQRDKPPLGAPPTYTKTLIDCVPGLTRIDSQIMKLACETAIRIGDPYINTEGIQEQAKSLEISQEEFFDSLEILRNRGYIEASVEFGGNIPLFSITVCGFEEYARVYIKDYDSILKSVALQIVNLNKTDNKSISSSLNQPQMLVDHILDVLENNHLIKVSKSNRGGMLFIYIFNVSPELQRMLRET